MKKIILVTVLFLASFVLTEAQSIKLEYKGENIENKLSFSEIRVEKSDEGNYTITGEILSPEFFEVVIKVAEAKKGKYQVAANPTTMNIVGNNGLSISSQELDIASASEGFIEITSSENGLVSGHFELKITSIEGELAAKGTFEKIKLE